jgi:alpha-beta hydrolase superfamily lysophospholipase
MYLKVSLLFLYYNKGMGIRDKILLFPCSYLFFGDDKMKAKKISFKKGLYQLNSEPNFNFQLNRVIMWNGGRLEDIEKIASKIVSSKSWKEELIKLAYEAETEGRIENSIAYYRMSEFFMYDGDPDKAAAYSKAANMFYKFYSDYFSDGEVKVFQVPYEDVYLPVMYAKAQGVKKDTILLHGGNDSYFEEFFFPMLYLSQRGFDVYLFEGPGQGGVLRLQGKHFTYKWELPVKAVLDYLNIDEVTIIGASLGGYLAPRSAAFEKRIKRVVAWSVFPDFSDVVMGAIPPRAQKLIRFLFKLRAGKIINFIIDKKLKHGNEMINWGLKHGMYAYEANTPYEYLQKISKYKMAPVADKINQDVLIIGASRDHFVDYRKVGQEINILINVHSLTFRLMTEAEQASNHCNCGNCKLVMDTIVDWIMVMKKENSI